jgi:hypothetical protein
LIMVSFLQDARPSVAMQMNRIVSFFMLCVCFASSNAKLLPSFWR